MKPGSAVLPLLCAAVMAVSAALSGGVQAATAEKAASAKSASKPVKKDSAKTAPPSTTKKPAGAAGSKTAKSAKGTKSAKARLTKKQQLAVKKEAESRAAAAAATRELNHFAVDGEGNPLLRSAAVVVQDQSSGTVLFEKNSDAVLPIASITKLMTAMVVLDAKQGLSETLTIDDDDVDTLRNTRSRLSVGTQLMREDMLRLALMSSENRAAASLARHYPGGSAAFIAAMNRKAADLGLADTRFFDSTGLNAGNVSSARDLCKMVTAATTYPLIREFTTTAEYTVEIHGRPRTFHNTNALVRNPDWDIGVSKTGFINEAGRCLVMQARLNQKPIIIVLLDSWGKLTRLGDANRIKRWVESATLTARPAS